MNKHTARLLEQHFDTAFAAPDGIKKLRELILTLAMQGKLVPQDPNDPPARELLKEIEAEKQRLIKVGQIKKPKPLPPVTEEEKPYTLPQGWDWVRLGDITDIIRGITFPASEKTKEPANGRIACLRTANVQKEIEWDDLLYINREFMTKNSQILQQNDIVISMANSRELVGKVAVISSIPVDEATFGGFLGVLRTHKVAPLYVLRLLNTAYARSSLIDSASQTTNIANISLGKLNPFLIPLPPIIEQHRIVAKIDKLMARCDELEKLRAAQQEKRRTVHAAAIKQLLNIAESDQHQRAQAFLVKHFGELYTVKENVTELRKAILQLAVMGKLVPQNSHDQPASELLKEIEAEKQRLVQEDKIKKPKPLSPVTEKEKPYALPQGWEWARLGGLNPEYQNGISKRDSNSGNEAIVLRLSDISQNEISYSNMRNIRLTEKELEQYSLNDGDILVTRVNGSVDLVGSFIRVRKPQRPLAYCDHFIRMRLPMSSINIDYLHMISMGRLVRRQIEERFVTTAGQKTVNQNHIATLLLPIPPLLEQRRIVQKVNELMSLCDSLEMQIDAATSKQSELLNALMHAQSQNDKEGETQQAAPSKSQVIDLTSYRAAIGCYAVNKLANAPYFGRTAAAKVAYLAQAHMGLELNLQPEREAAGPLDKWIYDFERQGQANRWFKVNEKTLANGRTKTEYRCLPALSEPVQKAESLMSPEQKAEFDRLICSLTDKTTKQVEIIATLFAVWNDFLIDGIQPTDEQIITDLRENWHESKARFSPAELKQWLGWLRKENLVPRGLPPRTVQQSRMEFH